jgi:hypothetical protein
MHDKFHLEKFDHITLHELQLKFETTQNANKISKRVKNKYERGEFRKIEPNALPTVLCLRDGHKSKVAIRVPAKMVDETMEHVVALEKWVNEFGCRLPDANDKVRGLTCVRHYACWTKFKDGLVPNISTDYENDGEISREFMKSSERLWERADTHFPKHLRERVFKDLKRFPILPGHRRFCGPWTCCAVNVAKGNRPVQTMIHRDVTNFFFAMSCLCPFGLFGGGGVIIWELEAVVILERGDLFYFMDHLLNHSNEPVDWGVRHSTTGFMDERTWLWMQETFGYKDPRYIPMRAAQEGYRKVGKERRKLAQEKKMIEAALKRGVIKDRKKLVAAKLRIEGRQRALKGGMDKEGLLKIIEKREREARRNEEKKLKSKEKK